MSDTACCLSCWQSHICTSPAQEFPKGEVLKFSFDTSTIYPGSVRDYWIYVPKQFDGKTPACVHVNQDGIQSDAPAVFDRLIHEKKMPVTIGVFVMHGKVPARRPDALDRFNRSYEYDGLGDEYARFLLEELLPNVETQKLPTAVRSCFPTKGMTVQSAEPPAVRFVHLLQHGNGLPNFHACSARLEPMLVCVEDTPIQRCCAKLSPSRFEFFWRMAQTISTSTAVTGGWLISRWSDRWCLLDTT